MPIPSEHLLVTCHNCGVTTNAKPHATRGFFCLPLGWWRTLIDGSVVFTVGVYARSWVYCPSCVLTHADLGNYPPCSACNGRTAARRFHSTMPPIICTTPECEKARRAIDALADQFD